jgi:hypothetical protein
MVAVIAPVMIRCHELVSTLYEGLLVVPILVMLHQMVATANTNSKAEHQPKTDQKQQVIPFVCNLIGI